MKIRIGTINELKGEGIEYLVDRPTRTVVLAKFFNGWMVRQEALTVDADEDTLVLSEDLNAEAAVEEVKHAL